MSPDDTIAEIRHRLAAPPAKVFSAFAEASMVSRWLTPSPEVTLTVLQFEFRIGGAYRFAYRVPGGATMFVNGEYRVIDPPSMIVFSWNIEPPDEHAGVRSEVTITLTPDGSGTQLLIRHEQLTQAGAAERHAEGWRGAINQLSAMLEADVERARFLSMLIQAAIFAWIYEKAFAQQHGTLVSRALMYGVRPH